MAKKLLVKIPQTRDGVTLSYDENKQPVYRQSIVELSARKTLESVNATMPVHLRMTFEEIEVKETQKSSPNNELRKRLAQLQEQKENAELHEKIRQLEAELAGFKGEATEASESEKPKKNGKAKGEEK